MNEIQHTHRNTFVKSSEWLIALVMAAIGASVGILQAIAPRLAFLLLAMSGVVGYAFLAYVYPFVAFMMLLFLALTVWLSVIEITSGISLMVGAGLVFAAVWLLRLAFQVHTFVKIREYGWLLGLVVMIFISSLFNLNDLGSFSMTFTYLQLFLLFVLVVNLITTPAQLRTLGMVIIASSTLVAVMILLDQLHLLPLQLLLNPASNVLVTGGYTRITRASGLWGGPNMTAVQLTMALPFVIEWWSATRSVSQRLLLLSMIAAIIAALLFTFSLGGIIGLVTIFLAKEMIDVRRDVWYKVFRIVFVCVLVGVVLYATLPDTYKQRFVAQFNVLWEGIHKLDEEQLLWVATGRGDTWMATVRAIAESPWVGHGPGNALAANAQYSQLRYGTLLAPHNLFLSVGSELGLVGLALFILLLISLLLKVSSSWRAQPADSILQRTGRAVFIALVSYLVQGLALDIQNLKLLWILLGMAAVYNRLNTDTSLDTAVTV